MARKYRRRRRRTRTRFRSRYRSRSRYRTRRRIPKYDEVKTYATAINSQALKVNIPATGDTTMYPESFIYNSMLNQITQGIDYFQRIGNQIYVLNIKFKMNVWMCSANEYELNTGLFRVIIGEPTGTALTSSITGFFRTLGKDKTLQPLNRKKYTFAYDRTYTVESGYTNRLNAATDPLKYSGAIRHFEWNLPMNRRVEYTQDGAVKNQRDQLSLFITPTVPNAINAQQVMCSNLTWTIYYVDA